VQLNRATAQGSTIAARRIPLRKDHGSGQKVITTSPLEQRRNIESQSKTCVRRLMCNDNWFLGIFVGVGCFLVVDLFK
ncbi:hypothetical protein HAX54_047151, partial [Datura stramonium]|nr:hypothetical protein [Datura stramonium]